MGIVFSMEEFSVYDGPGIRTTVFLKGCPLRCSWCHNPEGQSPSPQIIRNGNGCIGCGNCIRHAKGTEEAPSYTSACIAHCPQRLLRMCGEEYSPRQLCDKLLQNQALLADGGVTFSGGEPLLQSEFLFSCLSLLEGKLHRAIQTCGYASPEVFCHALSLTDYVLYDLKLMDDGAHIRYTGCSNRPILQNFEALAESFPADRFAVRVPLIPGVTDTEENLSAIAALLQKHRIPSVELLPYNKFAGSKYHLVGKEYQPLFDESQPPQPHAELFAAHGIEAAVL